MEEGAAKKNKHGQQDARRVSGDGMMDPGGLEGVSEGKMRHVYTVGRLEFVLLCDGGDNGGGYDALLR